MKQTKYILSRSFPIIFGFAILIAISSCASFGTNTRILNEKSLLETETVAVWPTLVVPFYDITAKEDPDSFVEMMDDPSFAEFTKELNNLTEELLVSNLRELTSFTVVPPSIVRDTIIKIYPNSYSFIQDSWEIYRHLVNTDCVIVTDVEFKKESGGTNTYVTLTLYHRESTRLDAEIKFNTRWGKSYLLEKSIDVTLPDAILGAVKGLAKEMKKLSKPQ